MWARDVTRVYAWVCMCMSARDLVRVCRCAYEHVRACVVGCAYVPLCVCVVRVVRACHACLHKRLPECVGMEDVARYSQPYADLVRVDALM